MPAVQPRKTPGFHRSHCPKQLLGPVRTKLESRVHPGGSKQNCDLQQWVQGRGGINQGGVGVHGKTDVRIVFGQRDKGQEEM